MFEIRSTIPTDILEYEATTENCTIEWTDAPTALGEESRLGAPLPSGAPCLSWSSFWRRPLVAMQTPEARPVCSPAGPLWSATPAAITLSLHLSPPWPVTTRLPSGRGIVIHSFMQCMSKVWQETKPPTGGQGRYLLRPAAAVRHSGRQRRGAAPRWPREGSGVPVRPGELWWASWGGHFGDGFGALWPFSGWS